jgi:hypothetical protein
VLNSTKKKQPRLQGKFVNNKSIKKKILGSVYISIEIGVSSLHQKIEHICHKHRHMIYTHTKKKTCIQLCVVPLVGQHAGAIDILFKCIQNSLQCFFLGSILLRRSMFSATISISCGIPKETKKKKTDFAVE